MSRSDLSPRAKEILVAILALTVNDLHLRLEERHGTADQELTREAYDAAFEELADAELIQYFPPEVPGEEGHAIPGPRAFDEVFRLFQDDVERLAAEHGTPAGAQA